ncbi:MAG: hypothetical protein LBR29_07945, partial [Methylobacteriaceae bacterium]|nr:hypothetical protein [Methylobacteriaceae bacterium]
MSTVSTMSTMSTKPPQDHLSPTFKTAREKLSELTGYSVRSIINFESSEQQGMNTYRLICAAVDAGATGFDWERSSKDLNPTSIVAL